MPLSKQTCSHAPEPAQRLPDLGKDYSAFLPAALTLAQRARALAAILARAAALILRFLALAGLAPPLAALTFAQRAFWAAMMRARPAALIRDFLRGVATGSEAAPLTYFASSASSAEIFSIRAAACRS